jgi:hypothetical protein
MKDQNWIVRQGDIALIKVDSADHGDELPLENGHVVLAHGEATGHKHQFAEPYVKLYATKTKTADRILKIEGNVAYLKHEEHSHIAVPPGTYIVRRQREWTDAEEPIQVAD